MFTGLIQGVGEIVLCQRESDGMKLSISGGLDLSQIALGDSIAVNGACLTVSSKGSDRFVCDLSGETLERTTFREIRIGRKVNLEPALRLSDRLGGHLVTGHIDGIGTLKKKTMQGRTLELEFTAPRNLIQMTVEKGSMAVEGVSLTVNRLGDDSFSVTIIPHTLEKTTLESLPVGAKVNLETDLLGKYVARLLHKDEGLTLDFLKKQGFKV